MRIALVNWSSRPVGGVGSYLRKIVPALARRGHDLAFWHEHGERPQGDPIALPAESPSWSVEQIGTARALAELAAWQPQVIVTHGLLDPTVEARTLQIAPAVFHAHGYHGMCISGAKTFKNPVIVPCSRTFGWPCLVNYFPRRCGGWSPVTMVREYHRQAQRLGLLSKYRAVLVYSPHLQSELARHGIVTTCLGPPGEFAPAPSALASRPLGDPRQLLFLGRMDLLKGGGYLLDALPRVVAALNRPVVLTFAGDGPARTAWEAAATRLMSGEPALRIEFHAWLEPDRVAALLERADLLVVPSLWPEPFGLVGLEAAHHRLPVAAFAVGGIRDWLLPGVNGYLAPGDPPRPEGLAQAIVMCLKDSATHARLREGAGRMAAEFDFEQHVDKLTLALHDAAQRPC